jgi:transcriptional regulator with XRE-family HTH domain
MLSDTEKQICARLKQFRESLQISRQRFALSIGITGTRLQSYELGRAPVRYEVFAAINKRFPLNPIWLGTGEAEPSLSEPFNDARFGSLLHPKMLLSEAVKAIFEASGLPVLLLISDKVIRIGRLTAEIVEILEKNEAPPDTLASFKALLEAFGNTFGAIDQDNRRWQMQRDKAAAKHVKPKA